MKPETAETAETKLPMLAIAISISSLIFTVGFSLYTHFNNDFSTTAFFNLANLDDNNNFVEYEVKVVNSGNRLVILERINKFVENKSKRKIDRKRLNEEALVIQPNEVVSFNIRQYFGGYEGETQFGTSFRVLTTEGNALLSSVVIGEFNKKDPSKFVMSISNLNLISNEATPTIYHSDKNDNNFKQW